MKIDMILCSYTGNTAHYTGLFTEGAQEVGAEVAVHRFHYHKQFKARLDGDALVIAFPVIGWKPPNPLITYLWKHLPEGHGKPAFILYTAAGGPENAGIIAWLLLKFKGYKVLGQEWAMYPNNVPTMRLGPARWWDRFDQGLPFAKDVERIKKTAQCFTLGQKCGRKFFIWPTPLWIIGILLDNKLINPIIYRNSVWRKRCIGCGLCVKYCPEERLIMKNGFPKAKGNCVLCLGCVNICPRNAMHMFGWTEYGNQYKPRWPENVVH